MRKFLIAGTAVATLLASAAYSQDAVAPGAAMPGMDHGSMAMDAPKSFTLPAACGTSDKGDGMMEDMGGMMGDKAAPADLDPVQKANNDVMAAMDAPMMAAAMIKDADLAFNCGMLAHHKGAVAMAEVELAMGKDEASKKLAKAIIDAQAKEIDEMTAWIETNAK